MEPPSKLSGEEYRITACRSSDRGAIWWRKLNILTSIFFRANVQIVDDEFVVWPETHAMNVFHSIVPGGGQPPNMHPNIDSSTVKWVPFLNAR